MEIFKLQQRDLIKQLNKIVGSRNVLTRSSDTSRYRKGFRFGKGDALAVVIPKTILEQWLIVKACVDANCIIITQAANTGLTGGSTPSGEDYDRDIVIISTLKINTIYLVNDGEQAISLSGATLRDLEDKLLKVGRTPHSVIGSTQIGATVVGGIANNSGGALVKRGPSYTEYALYAQVDRDGKLRLVNHLGIDGLGDTPEEILERVQTGDVRHQEICNNHMASDVEYIDWIRDLESEIPARFNADSRRLFEASGCAGKVCVFAVRTDTFVKAKKEQVFYLGTNNPQKLATLRKDVLTDFANLPDMAEYMHRTIFSVTERYGKGMFMAIKHLGSRRAVKLYKLKERLEKVMGFGWFDRSIKRLTDILPSHLPSMMTEYRNSYEHHLILCVSDDGICEMEQFGFKLAQVFR